MTTHTISGSTFKADGVTPNYGAWEVDVFSDTGYAFNTDPAFAVGWIGGRRIWTTNIDGSLSITLPACDGTQFFYRAMFHSSDKATTYGPFYFDLTANKAWTDIMTAPSPVPITPPLVSQVAADAAQVAEDRAAVEAIGTTNDTIIAGRINTPGSATAAALNAAYVTGSAVQSLSVAAMAQARSNIGAPSQTGYITVGKTRTGFDICTLDYASDDLAVQAAINLLASGFGGGNGIRLGPGNFDFVAGVDGSAKNNLILSGHGTATRIRWKNGNTFANTSPASNWLIKAGSYWMIQNLRFDGQSTFTCPLNGIDTFTAGGSNTLGGGLFLTSSRTWLRDVYISGMAEDGITNQGGQTLRMSGVGIIGCGGVGYNVIAGGALPTTDGDITSTWIGSCGTGVSINNGANTFTNFHVWGCQGVGVAINASSVKLMNCYIESNGSWGIEVSSASKCVITGNDLWRNGRVAALTGGIHLKNSSTTNNVVNANSIRDNRYNAILIDGASYNTVSGNQITDSLARSTPGSVITLTSTSTQALGTTFTDASAPSWMADANAAMNLTLIISGAGSGGSSLTAVVTGWNSPTSVTIDTPIATAAVNPTYVVHSNRYGIRETNAGTPNWIVGNTVHKSDAVSQFTILAPTLGPGSVAGSNPGWSPAGWNEFGSTSGAAAPDARNGEVNHFLLTGNVTSVSLFPSSPSIGMTLVVMFTQNNTGGWSVTGWPANVQWAGGAAPVFDTTAGTTGSVALRFDGTNWIEQWRSVPRLPGTLTYASGMNSSDVAITANTETTIMSTASLGVGVWQLSANVTVNITTASTSTVTSARINGGTATYTVSGPSGAQATNTSNATASNQTVTLHLGPIITVTAAGTVNITARCGSTANAPASTPSNTYAGANGWTAIKIA